MTTIIVTGGAGFIGSSVVRKAILEKGYRVINVDKLTYAGNLQSLESVSNNEQHVFEKVDICDASAIGRIFSQYKPDKVMHLAAESHVDRSIDGPRDFIETNIIGTYTLLEKAREYYKTLDTDRRKGFIFHHISTDEVYGTLGSTGLFTEQTRYKPNSPYSASKASSDHLVRAWHKTYELPVVISNCSNNYGPYQYPEKLIPLMINKALADEALPIYGNGENIRDWLYVDDHVDALLTILQYGKPGEIYNVGGHNELSNIQVVKHICALLNGMVPRRDNRSYEEQISFVSDRPGHDQRYAIDASKINLELSWSPRETFETGLRKTIQWYLQNPSWCDSINNQYKGERLGLGGKR